MARPGGGANNQLTEPGVTAIGVAVQNNPDGHPDAAVSISMPCLDSYRLANWVNGLVSTAADIEGDLRTHAPQTSASRNPLPGTSSRA
jgi:DNA-binding IclR family transcriptional regulator